MQQTKAVYNNRVCLVDSYSIAQIHLQSQENEGFERCVSSHKYKRNSIINKTTHPGLCTRQQRQEALLLLVLRLLRAPPHYSGELQCILHRFTRRIHSLLFRAYEVKESYGLAS